MVKNMLMLIGLPASGKSTFRSQFESNVRENLGSLDDYYVMSSDDLIEDYALTLGKTYNDVFADEQLRDLIMLEVNTKFDLAVRMGKTIIIDRTNMSVKSRRAYVELAKRHDYQIDAMVFARPMTDAAHDDWNRRLDRPGKTIPTHVLIDMFRSYVRPTTEEGFDNVIDVDTFN
jgi:predicted kinase